MRLAGGPQLAAAELAAVSPADWAVLAELAAEQRLEPWLHHRWGAHRAVPAPLRQRWAEAARAAALAALAQRRALLALVTTLAEAGLPALALKGAWLAWCIYPQAALRPMRDCDLLLAPGDAVRARALLLARGWREDERLALAPEAWLARFKHLPELVSPEGHWLDLHARLWDPGPGRPPAAPGYADLAAAAVADPAAPALRYPAPLDTLRHLAVHAAAHGFDGGPLMLIDIDRLLARETFDWPRVWRRAEEEGWARALALLLAATRRWGCGGLWHGPAQLPPVPETLIESLPALLVKPPAARAGDRAAGKRGAAGVPLATKARRAWERRRRYRRPADYLAWLAGEARLALVPAGGAATERRATLAALEAWLDG